MAPQQALITFVFLLKFENKENTSYKSCLMEIYTILLALNRKKGKNIPLLPASPSSLNYDPVM
jgi:hypothetical protein